MADLPDDDTLKDPSDLKSSGRILEAIKKAENGFREWQDNCDTVDDIYARDGKPFAEWVDPDFDLFWASTEITKPAIYAKPPQPVISPQFKDRRKLQNMTAEFLERSVVSAFDRADLDEAMLCVRDDLIFYNRGQLWAVYESSENEPGEGREGQEVCIDHLDRKDFLHAPARKWSEVAWVARRAWMTRQELRKRFRKTSGDAYMGATLCDPSKDKQFGNGGENAKQAGVWEVWHKADNRCYWVAEGVSVLLDEGEPHLKLSGFFPCPRPAYGTLRPRTLEPVPDYHRYGGHFTKINDLTRRIYGLLDKVKMKGLIAGGGDIGQTVQKLMQESDDTSLLIEVPAAGLLASGGVASFVQWLPLQEIAAAITGLIEARGQLIQDFYQLSGISDIMRGATEASETLGAQQLKTQFGSVRIREKVTELQRIACDVTKIAAEIMAENFSKDTLLEMSQMEIPTKAEIKEQVKQLEKAAEADLKELKDNAEKKAEEAKAKMAQQGQQPDPQAIEQQMEQGKQQFQQAQQQIIAKYGPKIEQAGEQVAIEDVMKLLRDGKARGFAFEIATDSTVMTDEIAEKQSRGEFLQTFSGAIAGLSQLVAMGDSGGELAGAVLKFVLQPYRVGRELNSVIDKFIDSAPQIAKAAQAGNGDKEAQSAIAQANLKLADAEMQKAQASIAKVQADAQGKMQEIQLRAAEAQAKSKEAEAKFGLELQKSQGDIAETKARIDKIMAEIQKLGVDASNQTRSQDREDIKTVTDIQSRQVDQAMGAQDRERAAEDSEHSRMMGERQQSFSERQAEQQSMQGEDK